MFGDKSWDQLLSYSKLEFPVEHYQNLPLELRPSKKALNAIKSVIAENQDGPEKAK